MQHLPGRLRRPRSHRLRVLPSNAATPFATSASRTGPPSTRFVHSASAPSEKENWRKTSSRSTSSTTCPHAACISFAAGRDRMPWSRNTRDGANSSPNARWTATSQCRSSWRSKSAKLTLRTKSSRLPDAKKHPSRRIAPTEKTRSNCDIFATFGHLHLSAKLRTIHRLCWN